MNAADAAKALTAKFVAKQAADAELHAKALQVLSELSKQRAVQLAAGGGMAALGVGAGLRGFQGLYGMAARNVLGPKEVDTSGAVPVDIPYPVHPKQKKADVTDLLKGDKATTTFGVPWAMPLATAAVGGGLMGGWKLVDKALDLRRKAMMNRELARARKDYDKALFSEFTEPKSACEKVAAELDHLYDQLQDLKPAVDEKRALLDSVISPNNQGRLLGVGGTVALLLAAAAASQGYSAAKNRTPSSLLEEAQKNRKTRLYKSNPTPLLATPVPVA